MKKIQIACVDVMTYNMKEHDSHFQEIHNCANVSTTSTEFYLLVLDIFKLPRTVPGMW